MGIRYSDGDSAETRVLGLIEKADRLDSDAAVGQEHYGEWPVRYHLSPERANLVRHLNLKGLDVLELGAGMGAVSRHLAEQAQSLTVIEGTQRRYQALSARLRDLSNWSGSVANVGDVTPRADFDVVFVVGVLEYSELYMDPARPFHAFLERASRFLRPGGVLIVAIENRLGLKYFNGCAEDHTGRVFDGVMGYSPEPTPKTFSLAELRGLLKDVGFSHQVAQFPFPDYKLPLSVLDEALLERNPGFAAELAGARSAENYDRPQVNYFSELLAWEGLGDAGLIGELSNSFLLVSAKEPSATWDRVMERRQSGELAWHYGNYRAEPLVTAFVQRDEAIHAEKRPLGGQRSSSFGSGNRAVKVRDTDGPLSSYPGFRSQWMRACHYKDWAGVEAQFLRFLRWGLKDLKAKTGLMPKALDAVATNARVTSTGFEWIDLEWETTGKMDPAWWVFRNVLVWGRDREHFPKPFPFRNLKGLYELLCRELHLAPDYARVLQDEAALNALIHSNSSADFHLAAIDRYCRRSWFPVGYPRSPRLEERLLRGAGHWTWARASRRILQGVLGGYRRLRRIPEGVRALLGPTGSTP